MAGASLMFVHFANRIGHCGIIKQLGIPMLRGPDRSESLGTKRELCEKTIDAFSASESVGEGPQLVSLPLGQTTFAASLSDFFKDGLAFVASSRLAHNQNELYTESATSYRLEGVADEKRR